MKQIVPYIFFPGNCREAMTYYKDVFDATLQMTTVEESPMAAQMPHEAKDSIINSRLDIGDLMIMASDAINPDGNVRGSAISILMSCDSEAEVRRYFDRLSADGTVGVAVGVQFWGDVYGSLTDKFGIDWMFNYRAPKS